MSNRFVTGAILPSGLFSEDVQSSVAGFNRKYKNHGLKAGIVVKSHPINSKTNTNKIAPEYDVLVIENDQGQAANAVNYRNCISAEGLGSIADYFEKTIRVQKSFKGKTKGQEFRGQDGAIVLLLCLDGLSEKAIIIGALRHPDRKNGLKGDKKQLITEFNGIKLQVEDDGSAKMTFRGATGNDGQPLDKKQGDTTLDIEKDGSVQIKNKGVTHRLQKDGNVSLTAEDSIAITNKKDFKIETNEGAVKVSASKGDLNGEMKKLILKASGSATMSFGTLELNSEGEAKLKAQMLNVEASSMAKIKASTITLDGMVALGGAGGTPALTMNTQFIGVGNLGAPVISQAVGPFSTKVTLT
jgi:hypothetical protein